MNTAKRLALPSCLNAKDATTAGRWWWSDVLVLILIVAVPAVVATLSGYFAITAGSDEKIAANFVSHEADFQRLVSSHQLRGDRRIKGQWLIHNDGAPAVAIAPY